MKHRMISKGFTLIEMVIAITILGILAGIGIPVYQGYIRKASLNSTIANLNSLDTAIDLFHGDTGGYPETLTDLIRRPADEELADGWSASYLKKKKIPKDGYGMKFVYHLNEEDAETPFTLYSLGPNKKKAKASEYIHA